MAMNRELLGREYRQAEKHVIDTEQIRRHRDAICAQSFTPLPDYAQRVPASCSLTICQGALTAALLDGDLGLDAMRLVFEGLDISYVHEPILDNETAASATVTEITSTPDGERLLLDLQLCQPALGPVLNARVAFLERNPRPKPENDGHTGASTSTDAEKPRYYFEHAIPLRMDTLTELLDVLGEFNPIYRDVELAQLANLPGPCLPQSCVFALAHHAVEQALGKSAHRITRVAGRFARTPWVGDTLRVRVGSANGRNGFIEILDSTHRQVFADAFFEADSDDGETQV